MMTASKLIATIVSGATLLAQEFPAHPMQIVILPAVMAAASALWTAKAKYALLRQTACRLAATLPASAFPEVKAMPALLILIAN